VRRIRREDEDVRLARTHVVAIYGPFAEHGNQLLLQRHQIIKVANRVRGELKHKLLDGGFGSNEKKLSDRR